MPGDAKLENGAHIRGDDWTLEAVYTPGHMSDHMCFSLLEENILFTGDHIMGWNTTLIALPNGNMRDYFNSLEVCLKRNEEIYWPAHGPPIRNPKPFTRAYRNHRSMREGQIIYCLESGKDSIPQIVKALYNDLPEKMKGAAAQSVLAHMEFLVEKRRVLCEGDLGLNSHFQLIR